ncbi:MAG: hypothetical protein ABIP94_03800, partial [Planctomycetota bacterium]
MNGHAGQLGVVGLAVALAAAMSAALLLLEDVRPPEPTASHRAEAGMTISLTTGARIERAYDARHSVTETSPVFASTAIGPAAIQAPATRADEGPFTVQAVQALQRLDGADSRRALVHIANDQALGDDVRVAALRALGDLPAPSDKALRSLWCAAYDETEAAAPRTAAAVRALGRALQQLPADDHRREAGRAQLAEALRRAMGAS